MADLDDRTRTLDAQDANATTQPVTGQDEPSGDDAVGPTGQVDPVAGRRIGRYTVQRQLGAGGMGVVYRAHDPALERPVALKLLRVGERGVSTTGRQRLVREAKAIAQLTHPNVVAVYDVGFADNEVFVAMEYVDGVPLSGWMKESGRTFDELVDAFAQAGAGLVAAHAKGIIHRDFKPDNVLIGRDGRVRVVDFGLARALAAAGDAGESEQGRESKAPDMAEEAEESDDSRAPPGTLRRPLNDLTRTGAVLGSPAYMAPEQWAGQPSDERTDQYSFCVSLYEALAGRRPFAGATPLEVASASRVAPPLPAEVAAPTWMAQLIARGLAERPQDRWPSMQAVLAELRRDRRSLRRRARGWAIGAVAVSGLVFAAWRAGQGDRSDQMCAGVAADMERVWNEARQSALDSALRGAGVSYAGSTADRVKQQLDRYAASWRAERTEACAATVARGEQSLRLLDLRVACLQRDLAAMDSLVGLLTGSERGDEPAAASPAAAAGAGAVSLEKAVTAAFSLPPPEACASEAYLRTRVDPPKEEVRQQVATLRSQLAAIEVTASAGDFIHALESARVRAQEADKLEYPPAIADAQLRLGELLVETGAYAEAAQAFTQAYTAAAAARYDDVAALAAARLVFVYGFSLDDREQADHWQRDAEVARQRLEAPNPAVEATLARGLGGSAYRRGDYEAALAQSQAAVRATTERVGSPDHPAVASAAQNVATVLLLLGKQEEAQREMERALAITSAALGADHPAVATAHHNLAGVLLRRGMYVEAEEHFRTGLAIRQAALGPAHHDTAVSRQSVANALMRQGKTEEALALREEGLAALEQSLGREHPDVATALNDLGANLTMAGRYPEAIAAYRRAVDIQERAGGPDHPELAVAINNLGGALMASGDYAAAETQLRRALSIRERALGERHASVASSLNDLGNLFEARGDLAEAERFYTRALSIRETALGADHPYTASTLHNLAEVYRRRGEQARALEQFQRAMAIWEQKVGPTHVNVAHTALGIARAYLDLGQYEEALASAERAERVCKEGTVPQELSAMVDFALARAWWEVRPERREQAVEAAQRARDVFRGMPAHARDGAEAQRWLAAPARRRARSKTGPTAGP